MNHFLSAILLSLAILSPGLLQQGCETDDDDTPDETDILYQLEAIEGASVREVPSSIDGYRFFYIDFDQPADHFSVGGLEFKQRLRLLHRSSDAPLVLGTMGYYVSDDPRLNEVSTLLDANQLDVEHRFFEPSRPQPTDWSLLTIDQAAADVHRVVEAFASIYPGHWISTGASKGGMTAVYHHRFYPEDVDGTVAYVAPHSAGERDERYITFLEQVGDASCREALNSFQRIVLERRDAMLSRMADLEPLGYTYEFLGEEQALEHTTLETEFAFWQYEDPEMCAEIPDDNANDDEVFAFLMAVGGAYYQSDAGIDDFEPYYYQASVQLGYPAYSEEGLEDLILYPSTYAAPTYVYPDIPVSFDGEAMPDISDWLGSEGSSLMFIYGSLDPWSAAMFDVTGATDTYLYVIEGGNHRSKILDLPESELNEALGVLEAWSGASPTLPESAARARTISSPELERRLRL